jgi:hypothetical protein
MQHLKPGDLVALQQDNSYYVFLVLSPAAFFGCQWAFAFHGAYLELPGASEVDATSRAGFVALIDFIGPRRTDSLVRIAKGIDPRPFLEFEFVKALISMRGEEPLWYIYDRHSSEILRKIPKLSKNEIDFPIWSGIDARDAIELIRAKWTPRILASPGDDGQYPLPRKTRS